MVKHKLKGAISLAKSSPGMASVGERMRGSLLSWSRAHRWVGSDQPSCEPTKDTFNRRAEGHSSLGAGVVYDDNNKSNNHPRLKTKKEIQHGVRTGSSLDRFLDMPGSLTRPPPLTLTPTDG